MRILRQVFAQNGQGPTEVEQVLTQRNKLKLPEAFNEEEFIRGVVVVPFCSAVTNQLTRILRRRNMSGNQNPL